MMAVISRDEGDRVLDALVAAGFTATFVESRGGMLRQAQYLLFIALRKRDIDQVFDIIRQNCHSQIHVEADVGGVGAFSPLLPHTASESAQLGSAVVFVWTLDQVEAY